MEEMLLLLKTSWLILLMYLSPSILYRNNFLVWAYWSSPIHKSYVNSSNAGFTPLSSLTLALVKEEFTERLK